MGRQKNIISVSGGKDSTALWLLAIERDIDVMPIFADTGHEHPFTYDYLDYLESKLGPIRRLKADFSRQIAHKRMFIARDQRHRRDKQGRKVRWTNKAKRRALAVLAPTGNPFLDLCLWKGRFPSTRRRFCSEQLKHELIRNEIVEPLMMDGHTVISWQGVRALESRSRANLDIVDEPEDGLIVYRPLIRWTVDEVFAMHRKHKIEWNPLYENDQGRVGCMPCIHSTKDSLRAIAQRWPEVIDRLAWWEMLVSNASKRGSSTFYDARILLPKKQSASYAELSKRVNYKTHGIRQIVQWAMTSRGKNNLDMFNIYNAPHICSSIYGLCESAN